jgi:peptidoglycan/xylan/chitin deacetylase (PgdA/CDA1 family)
MGEARGVARRWRPAPFITGSIVLHAVAISAWVLSAINGVSLLAALVANHLCITLCALWPRNRWLGENMVRLPDAAAKRGEVALTFDDGPDPAVTLQVLEILDRYGAKASFFCIGEKVRAYPHIAAEIIRRGHSVENHSQGHSHGFACFGVARLRRDIEAAQNAIVQACARRALFFRAPMGLRSPLLDLVTARMGLRYVSWTRRGFDTISRESTGVVRRLCDGLAAGDILMLHDKAPRDESDALVLRVLPEVLERIRRADLRSVSLPMALH